MAEDKRNLNHSDVAEVSGGVFVPGQFRCIYCDQQPFTAEELREHERTCVAKKEFDEKYGSKKNVVDAMHGRKQEQKK